MENQKLSKLQFYSLGIVANNKLPSSHFIEVTPVEEFPMLDGEITDNVEHYGVKSKDATEVPFQVEVKTTASIKAKWLPINNSNRRTSPDVRRGEHVVIYRFADTDEYWWNTLKNDNRLRRLETVIYSFCNLSTENKEDGPDSSYWLEVSTHKKLMHVHTSKNDGEPFAYDVQIDCKDGKFTIQDDAGNYLFLESRESNWHIQNSYGSFLDLNKSTLTASADIIDIIGKSVSVKSTNTNIDGGASITIASPSTSVN